VPEEIVLFEREDDNDNVTAEISAGYDVMLDQLKQEMEGDGEEVFMRQVEEMIHRSVQSQQSAGGDEIHKAYATLLESLQETGELDLDSLVENTIHTVSQQQSRGQ
jgi:hypothetical protein